MPENADNESLSPSRVTRRAPSKRRAPSVSTDTENKPARAAQSAQRLAQLSEPPRAESTLDLFGGDPAPTPDRMQEPDGRQGAPSGFALREPATSAAEVAHVGETAESVEVAASGIGGASAEGGEAVVMATERRDANDASVASESAATVPASGERLDGAVAPMNDAARTPVLADAEGVAGAAMAQADEASKEPTEAAPNEPMLPGQALAQLRAARTTAARRPAKGGRGVSRGMAAGSAAANDAPGAKPEPRPEPANAPAAEASPASDRAASQSRDATDSARAAVAAVSVGAVRETPPEPDHARAAAFADTVDALYGVIADQRRAAADLSRRMKWMLRAVAGALLVTVAAGVTQTIMLSRLATDVGAEQQRIAQMMQDQQAALSGVLARFPAQAEAPVTEAATQGAAHPAAAKPVHHAAHAALHGHRLRTPAQ